MYKRRRPARKSSKRSISVLVKKVLRRNQEEKYITYALNNYTFGTSSTASPPSAAWNEQLLNLVAGTPTTIQSGTGISNRIGNKIVFNRFQMKCYMTVPALDRVRIIVGKTADPVFESITSQPVLAAKVEANSGGAGSVFEEITSSSNSLLFADQMRSVATDVAIIHDHTYINYDSSADQLVPVIINKKLNLPRHWEQAAAATKGSWFVYMVGTASSTAIFGTMKITWYDE